MKNVILALVMLVLAQTSASAQFYGTDSSEKVHSTLITPIPSSQTITQASPFKVKIATGAGSKFQSIPTPFIVTLAPAFESPSSAIEEMLVGAVVGDSVTLIRRALSNTSAQSWLANAYFGIRLSYVVTKQIQDTLKWRFAKQDSVNHRTDSIGALLPTMAGHTNNVLTTTGSALAWASSLPISGGGTGASTRAAAFNDLVPDSTGKTNYVLKILAGGGYDWAVVSGSGTVTAVGLGLPSSLFSITNPVVTTAGTLSAALVVQNANTVFAGPVSGTADGPAFRDLVPADIPQLDASKTTSGTFAPSLLPILVGDGTLGGGTGAGGGVEGAAPTPVAGDSARYLKGNGTWASLDAGDIKTGTLPIARGGTGATTANGALKNVTPDSTGHTGQVLGVQAGGGYAWEANAAAASGTVTSITATSPLTGGTITTTGSIGIPKATAHVQGYLDSTDWVTFNGKGSGTVTTVTTTSPLTGTVTSSGSIGISQATTSTNGYLSSTDWNTFNSKQPALPSSTGNGGKVLGTDGTTSSGVLSWVNFPVSSVFGRTGAVTATTGDYTAAQVTNAVSQTGSYADPAWVTSLAGSKISGNISGNAANVTGTVAIANGGSGQTSAAAALTAFLPSQTGASGKVLQSNGTSASWQTPTGGVSSVTQGGVVQLSGSTGAITVSTPNVVDDGSTPPSPLTVTGSHAVVIGGSDNSAAGNYSGILGGFSNKTQVGSASAIIGGSSDTLEFSYGAILGGENLKTKNAHEVALGTFDDTVLTAAAGSLLTIGNGSDELNRSNALTVGSSGNIWANNSTLIYDGGSSTIPVTVLAPGTSGQVLKMVGSIPTWSAAGGTGTVTSVAATVPSWLAVSGSPITTTGTLAFSAATGQTANQFLATPNGTTGAVGLRAIVAADIPTLNQNTTGTSSNVTGTVALGNGGSGQTTAQAAMDAFAGAVTSGSYLRGNGTHVVMSAISAGDVPTLNQNTTGTASNVTGTVAIANGGTGATTQAGAAKNILPDTTAQTGKALSVIAGGGINWVPLGGSGTVTSVALTTPSWLTVSGSPVTASGTLAVTGTTGQTANQFLATPNGATGAVGLRSIVAADVPTLNQNTTGTSSNVTGTVAVTNGGTGLTSATLGDIHYASAANTVSALAGNTSSTKKFLTQTGTGTTSAAPAWGTIAAGDVPTLNQNTTGTASNVTGTVALGNGGSGQTTAQAAMDAFAGAVTSGSYLRGNGAHVVMAAISAGDVPTLNQNTTGTAANVTGTVAIGNGGTGQTTANAGFNALAPSQATNSGKYLTTDGTNTSWATVSGGGAVSSVFGRTGAVTATSGDYTASQVTNAADVTASNTFANNTQTVTKNGLAVTTANAVLVQNTTASTSGAQTQMSPAYGMEGHQWSGSADVTEDARMELLPMSSTLSRIEWGFNMGSGWSNAMTLVNNGNLSTSGYVSAGTGFDIGGVAPSGYTFRGNGTEFVEARLAAADVTNAVDQTGSYSNPSWITSLAGTKVSGNISGNAANVTGTVAVTSGGTGLTSATLGDINYASAANTVSALGGNTSSTKKYLSQTGTGSVSAAPAWSQPAFSELSGSATAAQLPTMVASGASHAAGIVPDPGSSAGSTKFLREDATWAVPAGAGGVTTFNSRSGAVVPVSGDYTASLVTNAADVTAANTFSGNAQAINRNGITTTFTDALTLGNTTASTSGVTVQQSPNLVFKSHVWNTTATAADNSFDAREAFIPTSGASPTAKWSWATNKNAAGFTERMSLTDAGLLTATSFAGSGASITALSGSNISSGTVPIANGGTGNTTYTNGQLLIGNTTGNTLTKATLTAGTGITVTNGTGTITIAATGGGGGLTNWTESVSTATPNATVPVVKFLATNAATDVDAVVSPKGAGGLAANTADNTTTGGNKRGSNAVDWEQVRGLNSQVASGSNATIVGGGYCTAGGNYSVAGGYNATASQLYDVALGGHSISASGSYSSALGGDGNTANAAYACALGGFSNTAAGSYSASVAGQSLTSNGYAQTVVGLYNTANPSTANTTSFTAADPLFIVGNGTSSTHSNALEVLGTGMVNMPTAGGGLAIKSSANCKLGTAILAGGTVTVANTSVTSNSLIFLSVQTPGGTQGFLSIGTRTAGNSFVINSTSATETSTVAYIIVEKL